MANIKNRISNCLWFDSDAETAAKFYISIFPNSSIGEISYYGKEGFEFHGKPEGSVMSVNFQLDGTRFMGLNGGPLFKFNESVSFMISCDSQDEIDHYWNSLISEGGEESYCGWLKDKFGVSWQVIPTELDEMMSDPDKERVKRATNAFLQMRKFDLKLLRDAFNGTSV